MVEHDAIFITDSTLSENMNGVNFQPGDKIEFHYSLKLVMTNSVNEENPSSTEKGFRESINTESYCGKWTHYAIVIQPDSLKCYINGSSVGTQSVAEASVILEQVFSPTSADLTMTTPCIREISRISASIRMH